MISEIEILERVADENLEQAARTDNDMQQNYYLMGALINQLQALRLSITSLKENK